MRLPQYIRVLALAAGWFGVWSSIGVSAAASARFSYHVLGDERGSWPRVMESIGLQAADAGPAGVVIATRGTNLSGAEWQERVEKGTLLILEGESPLAEFFGFKASAKRVAIRSVEDARSPKLEMVWEKQLALPVFEIPASAVVFMKERWQGAPLLAGLRRGKGALLWVAAPPGGQGYERFPYLPQALADLGMEPPFRSARLWAFFDSSYRARADVEYLAPKWRAAGLAALHVAAWHYWEPDTARDSYLRKLVTACHRNGIHVYAWLELPHVSEQFWKDHPEWREKTAIGQDAHLDWRRLMNLHNRAAFGAVREGVKALLQRFDWDGVNLAELYFESLEGAANPSRFTPMNDDVRREFATKSGFDPLDLFRGTGSGDLKSFLAYRADLARRQQEEWLTVIDGIRREQPQLDLVLTHVDDRFDTRMRDAIGADASRVLPLLAKHDFTFLVEDPATIWNLGPQRYPQIAARYAPLTSRREKLAIDINVVERYQDVYPTKQQTGLELFQLVREASAAFERVALYFENSLLPRDLPFLGSAAANVDKVERKGAALVISSRHGVGIPWNGPVTMDGRAWPVYGRGVAWLPAGAHAIEAATNEVPLRITDFNGTLQSARVSGKSLEFAYRSNARALVTLSRAPSRIEVDGVVFPATPEAVTAQGESVILLPRGQHLVVVE